ncbi:MAG: M23 family metallopeptidase [Candidatus Woesearchaeota archaeon]|jgi:murein DD-endopeptidase MepM/ murein hydrolase activator NlpD|nr:M23 family metallopeptidase [Candidatus Woesearchaeota archaeon]MDP7323616.1 M23 family metallopeptidase [Candidatus Woesearchaeota archaeon]MDP7458520.1 M23 family metallopeptidase [Candidatus Woesearchaeota archaeon]|tara:strand:+ start:1048 stop:1740 length:693 start_codon:yes stop_codon:yes gene_type:complete
MKVYPIKESVTGLYNVRNPNNIDVVRSLYVLKDLETITDKSTTFRLPFPETVEKRIGKPTGKFAHENFPESRYAIDFRLDIDTPILAARSGKVIKVKDDSDTYFTPKDLEGKTIEEIIKIAETYTNYVAIEHDDGTIAEYIHLGKDKVDVKEGQEVEQGDLLGYSGLSGVMSEPHLHFNVFKIKDGKAESIPVEFEEEIESMEAEEDISESDDNESDGTAESGEANAEAA